MKSSALCCIFAMASLRSSCVAFVANAPGARIAARSSVVPGNRPKFISKGIGAASHFTMSPVTAPLKPLVVCGPSGVGKGTIISKFMEGKKYAEKFGFNVSHTTRAPRPGEIDGVHYHFVSREFMLEKIESGSFFIEHAEVHGNIYGTSWTSIFDVSNEIESNNYDRQCLLDIDVKGVQSIKDFQCQQQYPKRELVMKNNGSYPQHLSASENGLLPVLDAKFIFIAPPSIEVLRKRLVDRGTETPATLERRYLNAKAELEYGMKPGNFDAIVVNDDLDQALNQFVDAVDSMYAL
ncbi:hypothetical protein ACHAWF_003179 [Thalassiosira exigua]